MRRACVIPGANKSALFTKQTNGGQSAAKSAYCAAMLKRTGRHRSEVVGVDMRTHDKQVDLRQHLGVSSSLIGTPDLQDIS
jgi:hypothetical protein